jgi:hypothetical protein
VYCCTGCPGALLHRVPRCTAAPVTAAPVLWGTAALVPWCTAAPVPWCNAALVLWCTAAPLPWCTAAPVPWYTAAPVLWCTAAPVPWCTRAPEHCFTGCPLPRCPAAPVHCCTGCPGALLHRCSGAQLHQRPETPSHRHYVALLQLYTGSPAPFTLLHPRLGALLYRHTSALLHWNLGH